MHDLLVEQLLVVLTTGLLAGYLCRQIGLPPLMGYLVVGAMLSEGVLGWVSADAAEIGHLAEVGVFFLLFSIGLELSLEELRRLGRHLFVGGLLQMVLVAVPVTGALLLRGWNPNAAMLVAAALAFSSTVLVFRSLGELGKTSSPVGRRAISILLFQDAALVPLLLCIPLLSGTEESVPVTEWLRLAGVSVGFVLATVLLRYTLNRWLIPRITQHRSPDLVVLMTLTILGGVTLIAHRLHLPPALGAFAAGLAFGGNRWSEQVDSLILPFREAFAAVFFVSLGLLIDVPGILHDPQLTAIGFVTLTLIKTVAAAVALRATGLPFAACWRPAVSLAHVGEFAFVLILVGGSAGVISTDEQRQLITLAGTTLLLAPLLMRWGLAGDVTDPSAEDAPHHDVHLPADSDRTCLVVGMGPVGRAVAARLETHGYAVTAVDANPLNLQAFAQHGFPTVAGDAQQEGVLRSAGADQVQILVICVPIDEVALAITRQARALNSEARIVVRCRYASNRDPLRRTGADVVISEEARSTRDLIEATERVTAKDEG
ncbi:Glutathione-regulated potassium-efflux system protein KefC [Maioricimonas rarisocia]|uniref:Glutathione-regulated potassium-efflux system protein KefC n=1 Tax=Maioricimonas rarisocia TaxID=2528026 RepID=A0A517Z0Y4_9PLAN|nr:cation:proton antiporter [Maioricimonas rarisocia]QDU36133.1 Glutathione-regulated potassium-efflux system protein KefC [Maioricimonas rarisocia]